MSKTTEEREVTPQFGGVGNLGVFTINPVVFSPESLDEAIADPLVKRAVCHLLNSQAHINFAGPQVYKAVRAVLEKEHGKPEAKAAKEWHAKHYSRAQVLAMEMVDGIDEKEAEEHGKTVTPAMEFDYVERVKEWAKTDFANRGSSQGKRPVLAQYVQVEAFITKRWAVAKPEAKQMCLSQLKLTDVTVDSTSEEVLAQLAKQYQAPVSVDLTFADE